MKEGKEAEDELKDSFPEELYRKAVGKGVFGGEYNFEKMSFFEKMVVKKVAGVEKTKSNILEKNIEKFADNMKIKIDGL